MFSTPKFMVPNYVAPPILSSTIYIHTVATKVKFSKEAAYNGVTVM